MVGDVGVLHALGVKVVLVISVQPLAEQLLVKSDPTAKVKYVGINPVTDEAFAKKMKV